MKLKIFAELDKNTLNEPQRKLIEDLEKLLYSSIELDRYYGVGINELTDELVDARLGTSKGPLWIKLRNDGVFGYRFEGSCLIQPERDINNPESLKYFKEYLGEFKKEQNTETKRWFPRLSKRNKRKRRR